MVKQNRFALTMRINANIVFVLLLMGNKRLDYKIDQFTGCFTDLYFEKIKFETLNYIVFKNKLKLKKIKKNSNNKFYLI